MATAWTYWTDASTTACTTGTWKFWNTTGGTTAATAAAAGNWVADNTWTVWVAAGTVGYASYTRPRTPEEIAADEERWRVQRAQQEERQARERVDREQAVQRAETLLHAHLSDRQRRILRRHGRFYVRSQHGRRYEIERGHHANVYELNAIGQRIARLCVYPTGGLPEADCMLAQKLHLQADEERFRRTANITPLRVEVPA